MIMFILVFLFALFISFLISAALNGIIIYFAAKMFAEDRSQVTILRSFWCAIQLAFVGIAAVLAAILPALFLGIVGLALSIILGLYLFYTWGTAVISNTFDMGSGSSTVLIIYVAVSVMINRGVDALTDDGSSSSWSDMMASDEDADYEALMEEMGATEDEEPAVDSATVVPEPSFNPAQDAPYDPMAPPLGDPAYANPAVVPAVATTAVAGAPMELNAVLQLPPEQRGAQAELFLSRAREYWAAGQPRNALTAGERALAVYQSYLPETDPQVTQTRQMVEAARQQVAQAAPITP